MAIIATQPTRALPAGVQPAGALSTVPAAIAAHAATAGPDIAPFTAHYQADWRTINVGTSDLSLAPGGEPGHYLYTWTITARGIFRLYRAEVTQKSWLSIHAGHVRPDRYSADDGSSTVSLDFDWNRLEARGVSEQKPVDLSLKQGTQDVMSIQIEVMLDLRNGTLPAVFQILDKDELKEFVYTEEGRPKLRTALGELDTIVVSSRRAGGGRLLKMWFAPSLGYIPVQAERSRDGKLEFAIRIRSLQLAP
jgi:hypothetical protein